MLNDAVNDSKDDSVSIDNQKIDQVKPIFFFYLSPIIYYSRFPYAEEF